MIQKIKSEIENSISKLLLCEDFEKNIKYNISTILEYHKSKIDILDFKIVHDNSNNTPISNNSNYDIYIKLNYYSPIDCLNFSIDIDRKKIIRIIREKKIKKINNEYNRTKL